MIGFSAALRGEEIMMIDLHSLSEHLEDAAGHSLPFVPISLVGRFKGETGNKHHYMPVVAVSKSGLDNYGWSKRMVEVRQEEGRKRGWLFQDSEGKRCKGGIFLFVLFTVDVCTSTKENLPEILPQSRK